MSSIGTLSEKSVHAQLKNLIADEKFQEIKCGRYVADIKIDNTIYEIQTQQFKKLIPKLEYYISCGYNIVVVYPLIQQSYINYIDELNDIVDRRKSSYKRYIQDIFKELYWIKDYIVNEQIKLTIVALEVEEYKQLNGVSKYRATKIDKVPTKVVSSIDLCKIDDFYKFLPDTLPKEFDSNMYKKHTHSRSKYLGSGLKMLRELGIIQVVRKEGNKYIYSVRSKDE